jgi:hypothetical protein
MVGSICWAFYVVNDNKPMDAKIPQVMRIHLCYDTHVLYNPRTKTRKGLISYYKTNGILTLKMHVDAKHSLLAKKLDEEVNSSIRTQGERQPTKKRQNVSSFENFKMFSTKLIYKKDKIQHKQFFENLALLIV